LQAPNDGVGGHLIHGAQLVELAIADGRLVLLPEAWRAPFPGYILYYLEQWRMAPAFRAFC
jgi:hypothetical protein